MKLAEVVVLAENDPTARLAWLLAVLDHAGRLLEENMFDVDAKLLDAHRAELARGHNWPGDPIKPVPELESVARCSQGGEDA